MIPPATTSKNEIFGGPSGFLTTGVGEIVGPGVSVGSGGSSGISVSTGYTIVGEITFCVIVGSGVLVGFLDFFADVFDGKKRIAVTNNKIKSFFMSQ